MHTVIAPYTKYIQIMSERCSLTLYLTNGTTISGTPIGYYQHRSPYHSNTIVNSMILLRECAMLGGTDSSYLTWVTDNYYSETIVSCRGGLCRSTYW